ncbi:MAG TPA: TonB-dependent receptor [Bacteroidia bacterium]|jgi:hypothetical protein
MRIFNRQDLSAGPGRAAKPHRKKPLRGLCVFASLWLLFLFSISAHAGNIKGIVRDSVNGQSIPLVSISTGATHFFSTDALGNFCLKDLPAGKYQLQFYYIGYRKKSLAVSVSEGNEEQLEVNLQPDAINLDEVVISRERDPSQNTSVFSVLDKELRPVNSSQDLLRLVPGLFTAQHAGGGKAEQIFLRGFDCDHGTDFSVNVDGMPVNMVSHAHGQGYADMHFVIPETVDGLNVYKGPYSARFGDFATAGAGEFFTKNSIEKDLVKMEYGMFDNYRALGMFDLLHGKHLLSKQKENLYVAGEYVFFNSYFDHPQDYSRHNLFGKYYGRLNDNTSLSFSVSTFSAGWNASGQLPERAVREHSIGRFGSIDDSEGGNTSRSNVNLVLASTLKNGALIKNQLYYSYYTFDLYSNFTFYLNDPVHGDEIEQKEKGRSLAGYNGTYEKYNTIFGKKTHMLAGIGTRVDNGDVMLLHTEKRQLLDTIVAGHLLEQNINAFTEETVSLTDKLTASAGLRFDEFIFNYWNYKINEPGNTAGHRLSPKLNLSYEYNRNITLFIRSGMGFHSNDARAVVSGEAGNVLPRALGYEAGSTFRIGNRMLVNTALWGLDLQNELVYVGDDGKTEISGATRRLGADLAVRWELNKFLFADLDLNYNHGRYKDLPAGEDFIPLAPGLTSVGGLTVKNLHGFSGSLRYRCMSDRPANENNTVIAKGYFLLDAVVNYNVKHFTFGLMVQNLLNTEWNEAQFDTLSRLKGETVPVDELHFTAGSPFFLKGLMNYSF